MALKHFGLADIGHHNPGSLAFHFITPPASSPIEEEARRLEPCEKSTMMCFIPSTSNQSDRCSSRKAARRVARIKYSMKCATHIRCISRFKATCSLELHQRRRGSLSPIMISNTVDWHALEGFGVCGWTARAEVPG